MTDTTGDQNQRYEVRYISYEKGEKEECVLGQTNDPLGGGMVEAIEKHPVWEYPVVIDRQTGERLFV